MKLKIESPNLKDYLEEIPGVIEFNTPLVSAKINHIKSQTNSKKERARLAFEVARDEISHSFDTGAKQVTIGAEEVLKKKDGICFAKSHLLASMLRGMDIPAGFCYQRVTRRGTVESGYALHGLNAIYFEDSGWFRVDPRGNKEGIDAQFSIGVEKLAYPIREELGEIDYPDVFVKPLKPVLTSMKESADSGELFYKRPEAL